MTQVTKDVWDFITHSNAIENYYMGGMAVPEEFGGPRAFVYTMDDPYWTNHLRALEHLRVSPSKLSVEDVEHLHGLLCENIMPAGHRAGELRTCNVSIGGHIAPQPQNVRWMLRQVLEAPTGPMGSDPWYLHYAFETVHPFADGNGRLGRLLLLHWFYEATQQWESSLVQATVDHTQRMAYYQRINDWRRNHADRFFGRPLVIL